MNKIYILYKLENRAETTDTLIYYASYDRGILEEIILSLWEEAKDTLNSFIINDENKYNETLKIFINKFNIMEIPLI